MLVGYARVSTLDQNPSLQIDALREAGCGKIYVEKASGARRNRPQLKAAFEYLRDGDTLVVWKLSRLARSLKQVIQTVQDMQARNLEFKVLTQKNRYKHTGRAPVFSHDGRVRPVPARTDCRKHQGGPRCCKKWRSEGRQAALRWMTRKSASPRQCSETGRTIPSSMTSSSNSRSDEPNSIATSHQSEFENSGHRTTEMSAMQFELTQIVGIGEVSGKFRCSQPQSAAFARAFTRQQPLRAPVGPLWDFWYLCWVGALYRSRVLEGRPIIRFEKEKCTAIYIFTP